MAFALGCKLVSPTTLLYTFVVITQFGYGFYFGQRTETSVGFEFLHLTALLWIVGWWLQTDSRKRGYALIYDMGFFLCIAWPIVMTYYLLKTRGAKGLLIILAFVGVYVGAPIVGAIASLSISVLSGNP